MTTTPPEAAQPAPPSRWRIFGPTLALVALVAVYSVYWYVMAGKTRGFLDAFATSPHTGNIAVGWGDLSISGYPYRIEADFTAPSIAAPRAPEAWSWSAQSLEADFLPYSLRHVVLKVDGEQVLRYRDDARTGARRHVLRATAEGTWASYVDVRGAPFGRLAVDINNLVAVKDGEAPNTGERFAAGRFQFHSRPSGEQADGAGAEPLPAGVAESYDVAIQGNDMAIDAADAPRALGSEIELFEAQARLKNASATPNASPAEFARAWATQGGTLTISDMQVKWGPLDMWAQGELSLDAEARPQGRFEAAIADYPGLLKALVAADVVSEKDARIAQVGLGLVAQLQGDEAGRIRVPVVVTGGKVFLGPVPVATIGPLF